MFISKFQGLVNHGTLLIYHLKQSLQCCLLLARLCKSLFLIWYYLWRKATCTVCSVPVWHSQLQAIVAEQLMAIFSTISTQSLSLLFNKGLVFHFLQGFKCHSAGRICPWISEDLEWQFITWSQQAKFSAEVMTESW